MDSTKSHPKQEGAIYVAGRWMKARIATARRYLWRNKLMEKGNFVDGKLDDDGELTVEIKSNGKDDQRVGGRVMLDDVFDHFGDRIKRFKGQWPRWSTFTTNYDEYMKNIDNNMTPKEAARSTWTGRYLSKRGFDVVDVHVDDDLGVVTTIWAK